MRTEVLNGAVVHNGFETREKKLQKKKCHNYAFACRGTRLALTLNFNTIKYALHLILKKSFTVKLFYCSIILFICRCETVEKRLNKATAEREDMRDGTLRPTPTESGKATTSMRKQEKNVKKSSRK